MSDLEYRLAAARQDANVTMTSDSAYDAPALPASITIPDYIRYPLIGGFALMAGWSVRDTIGLSNAAMSIPQTLGDVAQGALSTSIYVAAVYVLCMFNGIRIERDSPSDLERIAENETR